jgi:hypothetical protein
MLVKVVVNGKRLLVLKAFVVVMSTNKPAWSVCPSSLKVLAPVVVAGIIRLNKVVRVVTPLRLLPLPSVKGLLFVLIPVPAMLSVVVVSTVTALLPVPAAKLRSVPQIKPSPVPTAGSEFVIQSALKSTRKQSVTLAVTVLALPVTLLLPKPTYVKVIAIVVSINIVINQLQELQNAVLKPPPVQKTLSAAKMLPM